MAATASQIGRLPGTTPLPATAVLVVNPAKLTPDQIRLLLKLGGMYVTLKG